MNALRARALVLVLVLTACGGGAEPTPRNLLLISIDTLRADALSCYGNERATTPQLDAFAAAGTRFASAWACSPKTAPSHMTMLTGLPPRAHGVGNLDTAGAASLGPAAMTLAEILQARGLRTAGFTDGGNAKGKLGFDRGFETFNDKKGRLADKLPRLQRWMGERQAAGEPWFLFVHSYDVHDPYYPTAASSARFCDPAYGGEIVGDRAELERRVAAGDDRAPNAQAHDKLLWNYWRRVDQGDPADLRHLHDLYLAGVADLDAVLGRLFGWLEERGLLEDTLVVITSDHGEEFGEHGMTRHEQLWREVLHVPLIVRAPGGRGAGLAIDAQTSLVDLVPSLLELLDLPDPRGLEAGVSWAGWLDDPAAARDRAVFAEHRSKRDLPLDLWTLRDEDWLLHRDREGLELRRLDTDPAELEPADDARQVERLEELRRHRVGRLLELARRYATGEGLELDPETLAEIQALGYGGDEPEPAGGEGAGG